MVDGMDDKMLEETGKRVLDGESTDFVVHILKTILSAVLHA